MGRHACDDEFRSNMYDSYESEGLDRVNCYGIADLYYVGVRVGGSGAFGEGPIGVVTVGPPQTVWVTNPGAGGVVTVGTPTTVTIGGGSGGTVTVGSPVTVSPGSSSGRGGAGDGGCGEDVECEVE